MRTDFLIRQHFDQIGFRHHVNGSIATNIGQCLRVLVHSKEFSHASVEGDGSLIFSAESSIFPLLLCQVHDFLWSTSTLDCGAWLSEKSGAAIKSANKLRCFLHTVHIVI